MAYQNYAATRAGTQLSRRFHDAFFDVAHAIYYVTRHSADTRGLR